MLSCIDVLVIPSLWAAFIKSHAYKDFLWQLPYINAARESSVPQVRYFIGARIELSRSV